MTYQRKKNRSCMNWPADGYDTSEELKCGVLFQANPSSMCMDVCS